MLASLLSHVEKWLKACLLNGLQVLFYVPNVVGYARIFLLVAACSITGTTWPHVTVALFLVNFCLDALDGFLARRLCQVTP